MNPEGKAWLPVLHIIRNGRLAFSPRFSPTRDAPTNQNPPPTTDVFVPVPRIGTLTLAKAIRLSLSLNIGTTGSQVPYQSLNQSHATSMPDAVLAVSRHRHVVNEAEISEPPRVNFVAMPASASGVSNYRKRAQTTPNALILGNSPNMYRSARAAQPRCHWLNTHWTSVCASSGEIGPPRSADSGIDISPQCALPPSRSLFSSITSALRLSR